MHTTSRDKNQLFHSIHFIYFLHYIILYLSLSKKTIQKTTRSLSVTRPSILFSSFGACFYLVVVWVVQTMILQEVRHVIVLT